MHIYIYIYISATALAAEGVSFGKDSFQRIPSYFLPRNSLLWRDPLGEISWERLPGSASLGATPWESLPGRDSLGEIPSERLPGKTLLGPGHPVTQRYSGFPA